MVAIAIVSDQIYAGDGIPPEIHPAALLFPTKDPQGVTMLAEHIRQRGLRKPIVMTPSGQLLEGRGRWKACRHLGINPTTEIERGDPWLYTLRRNDAALSAMTDQQRAMVAGQIPRWRHDRTHTSSRHYGDPPVLEDVAAGARVSRAAVTRAQIIWTNGVKSLHQIVNEGRLPLNTAVRISELPVKDQELFVQRILGGESPRAIAPSIRRMPDGRRTDARTKQLTLPPVKNKNRYVRATTVRQLVDVLVSVKMVVEAAEGLDPTITPEEAAEFSRVLSRNHIAYSHLNDLLKERKQEES